MTAKVSVIITTYNSQLYIKRSLESVINQTFNYFEIIIIDDCSNDNTCEIIKNYQKSIPNIKLFSNAFNMGGPAFGRNIGIKKSKGNFIAFLDADDFWLPKKLEFQMSVIKNNNYHICGCKPINNKLKFNHGIISLFKLISRNRFYLSSTVFDLNKIKNLNLLFNESKLYNGVEDYDFLLRCSLNNFTMFNLNLQLISYTEDENSLSHSDFTLNENRRLQVLSNLKFSKLRYHLFSSLIIIIYKLKIFLNEF
ncbi:glycosyltransferase [Flavobacteriaceae bacterium]|nr:glycosyltransferase [Flavobacteriaceae bacterium]